MIQFKDISIVTLHPPETRFTSLTVALKLISRGLHDYNKLQNGLEIVFKPVGILYYHDVKRLRYTLHD